MPPINPSVRYLVDGQDQTFTMQYPWGVTVAIVIQDLQAHFRVHHPGMAVPNELRLQFRYSPVASPLSDDHMIRWSALMDVVREPAPADEDGNNNSAEGYSISSWKPLLVYW